MDNGKKKRIPTAGKVVLIILAVLLVLVAVAAAFLWGYMNRKLERINREPTVQQVLSSEEVESLQATAETREEGYTGPVYEPEDITWPSEPPTPIDGKQIINILLIGQDRRPGQPRQRSDAMILCTLNLEKETLTMTSFLRDMYVKIPGYGENKINLAYQIGGMDLLDQVLEVNFGVHVDGNVEVDFSQFERIVDMMGGVDIVLTSAEAHMINENLHAGVTAGLNHLDGELALFYSRIRYIGTDFGRSERQRTVLETLVEKCQSMDLVELDMMLDEICTMVTTDMTNAEIMDYALDALMVLNGLEIRSQRVPIDDSYYYGDINGVVHCIFIDFEANRQMLLETLMS